MYFKLLAVDAAWAHVLLQTSQLVSGDSITDLCWDFSPQDWVDELIESNTILTISNYEYTGTCSATGLVTDDDTNYIAYTSWQHNQTFSGFCFIESCEHSLVCKLLHLGNNEQNLEATKK